MEQTTNMDIDQKIVKKRRCYFLRNGCASIADSEIPKPQSKKPSKTLITLTKIPRILDIKLRI